MCGCGCIGRRGGRERFSLFVDAEEEAGSARGDELEGGPATTARAQTYIYTSTCIMSTGMGGGTTQGPGNNPTHNYNYPIVCGGSLHLP